MLEHLLSAISLKKEIKNKILFIGIHPAPTRFVFVTVIRVFPRELTLFSLAPVNLHLIFFPHPCTCVRKAGFYKSKHAPSITMGTVRLARFDVHLGGK